MEKKYVSAWRKIFDVTLIILCWMTISPLMYLPNRHYSYLKKGTLIWLMIVSPFTWTVLTFLFLIRGVPVLTAVSPSFASMISSFPEFTGALSASGNGIQLLLLCYLLPIYSFCVVFLFVSMALTGWTYMEASVQICEYLAPWVCVFMSFTVIIMILARWNRMTGVGKAFCLIPIGMEGLMAMFNYDTYRMRVELYQGMSTDQIFDYAVKMLVSLGEKTHTDYITANIIVYILPPLSILFIAYLGWIIYTLHRKRPEATQEGN